MSNMKLSLNSDPCSIFRMFWDSLGFFGILWDSLLGHCFVNSEQVQRNNALLGATLNKVELMRETLNSDFDLCRLPFRIDEPLTAMTLTSHRLH